MLPKFLIADNSQEAPDLVYVVHTEKPQCIIQCDMDGFYSNQKIYWIDEEPLCTDDIESLMEEAEEFFETELENQEELYDEVEDKKVYTLQEEQEGYTIKKEDGIFVVDGPAVDRVMRRVNLEDNESMYYFQKCLDSLGVNQKLKEAGVQEGDTVNICGWELEWYD